MREAILVEGLRKSYNGRAALKDVNFHVAKGEIFALLGVNGAGKTTALECVEGLRSYEGGRIEIHGRTGIQLQSASLPASIRPMEALRLFSKWNRADIDGAMLAALGIGDFAGQQYAALSTGQKRRLHLALALVGDPDVVFLDEPTAGLDVEGRLSLHGEIRKLKARGKTILLASHDMAEVESLCDRIAILSGGEIVFQGTVPQLGEKIGKRFTVSVKTSRGEENVLSDDVAGTLLDLLQNFRDRGVDVLDVRVSRGALEQQLIDVARRNET